VSVIIPIHNGERYLGAALDSVDAQDYEARQVIVVDDGSTDGGAVIAAAHNVVLIRQEQRGAGAARNVGIDRARGEILMFLDQDDLWLPHKIRRQVEILTEHPDRICIAQQSYFIEPGHAKPLWFGKEHLLVNDHAGWAPSCLAVRRPTFDRVGRFDWHARASHLGIAVEKTPETLVHRRIHGANNSASLAAMTEFFTIVRSAVKRNKSAVPESS
jgi:glycosyltransferase involved in cell wall biosynthesis